MDRELKYVVIVEMGIEVAIVGPNFLNHRHLFNPDTHKPISAGFCSHDWQNNLWTAWGRSVTLDLQSRLEDRNLLNKLTE